MIRTYSELILLPTFEERFDYLRLNGQVGYETFGFDRWMNQEFYNSREWHLIRNKVIARDLGCDLAILDRRLIKYIIVHHMNPISQKDIEFSTDFLLNPEYLITIGPITHKAVHYGDENLLVKDYIPRTKNDTCPWR